MCNVNYVVILTQAMFCDLRSNCLGKLSGTIQYQKICSRRALTQPCRVACANTLFPSNSKTSWKQNFAKTDFQTVLVTSILNGILQIKEQICIVSNGNLQISVRLGKPQTSDCNSKLQSLVWGNPALQIGEGSLKPVSGQKSSTLCSSSLYCAFVISQWSLVFFPIWFTGY